MFEPSHLLLDISTCCQSHHMLVASLLPELGVAPPNITWVVVKRCTQHTPSEHLNHDFNLTVKNPCHVMLSSCPQVLYIQNRHHFCGNSQSLGPWQHAPPNSSATIFGCKQVAIITILVFRSVESKTSKHDKNIKHGDFNHISNKEESNGKAIPNTPQSRRSQQNAYLNPPPSNSESKTKAETFTS